MYTDERIDYTSHMKDKPQESDPAKLATMKEALVKAMKEKGVRGHVSATYYTDGNVLVRLDGEYYGVFDSRKGEFFSGYVGDYEWSEPYKNAAEREAIAQALDACSRKDCAHCLYQGKGIKCAQRLLLDAASVLKGPQA